MVSKLDNQTGSAVKPSEFADTPLLLVKAYQGKEREAIALLQSDSIEMATQGYFPTWQNWTPGEWSREAYVVAVLLIFLFGMGILILAYLLIVEPEGRLTVAYKRRAAAWKTAKEPSTMPPPDLPWPRHAGRS
jgi:hypothetical protein